jgi:hypothetical protein
VLIVDILICFQDNMPITMLFDFFSSSEHARGSLLLFLKHPTIGVGIIFPLKTGKTYK